MAYLERALVKQFSPLSPFVVVNVRSVEGDPTSFVVVDKEAKGRIIKGVKKVEDLLAVLGLGEPPSVAEYVLSDGKTINEAKIREGAGGSEAAFAQGLAFVQERVAAAKYHKKRIRARAKWAKETTIAITYAEYHALCGIAQRSSQTTEELYQLSDAMVTHLSQFRDRLQAERDARK